MRYIQIHSRSKYLARNPLSASKVFFNVVKAALLLLALISTGITLGQDSALVETSRESKRKSKSTFNKEPDITEAKYITKIAGGIQIDGIVNEPIWQTITPLSVTQKVPNAGASPTQKTEIRITYDENYIYLSGKLFDNEPNKINTNSKKRDDFTENSEWFGFLIDTYDDRENALAFYVTPNGSRLDMALSNDMVGPNAFNVDWNTFWDASATITEEGWFAEMRIPFSSLPFEVVDGKTIMGITAWRYLARNDETDIFPPRDLSTGSSFRPSLTQRFVFEGVEEKKAF